MVKRRNLAQLRGFQAFDAVARHLSVTAAAEELGVTQSAVSHQLRRLSDLLGETLVARQGRATVLTEPGQRLAEALDGAFDVIEQSASMIIGQHQRILRVAVYSSFASGWLIPALPEFRALHPDIDLRLIMVSGDPELSDRTADAFITSDSARRGFWSTRLCRETLVPVIAPSLLQPGKAAWPQPLITAEAETMLVGTDWEGFFRQNELSPMAIRDGDWICCTHFVLALDMALVGLGAALLPDFLAAEPLRRGDVIRLPGEGYLTGLNYDLSMKSERRNEPSLAAFSSWITKAMRKYRKGSGARE